MKRRLSRLVLAAIPLVLVGAAGAQVASVGLSSVRAQRFGNVGSPTLPAEAGDHFAAVLATGDFDGDGAYDLATGVPDDDGVPGSADFDSGLVVVRYGRERTGLGPRIDTLRPPDGEIEPDDRFGRALASCDFDGDSFADLAVGAPGEDVGALLDSGAVLVFHGGSGGLSMVPTRTLTQDTPGLPDVAESGDAFGFALACGDFDGDGFEDLVVGSPGETLGGAVGAGVVVVLPGSAAGLEPNGSLDLRQGPLSLGDVAETGDGVGRSLEAGDWNGDGFQDLGVGAPGENLNRGALHVLFGTLSGISPAGRLFLDETGIGGLSEIGDEFAFELEAGDFDGDAHDDLAIGIPGEDFGAGGSIENCGQVNVLQGAPAGFDFGRTQFWAHENLLGVGESEFGDLFGMALAAGDFDRDGRDDLAAGAPGEVVLFIPPEDGAVAVIMGSAAGLSVSRHRLVAAGLEGFPGDASQHHRRFSFALAVGDLDGDDHADLAVGAPVEDEDGLVDVGAETVLYGALFADGFETGTAALWTAAVP